MKGSLKISAVCSAALFIFSLAAKAAGDARTKAATAPVPQVAVKLAEKVLSSATSYAEPADTGESVIGHTEFDEFNNINDPLYREGSKELLEQAIVDDSAPKAAVKDAPAKQKIMRDAPADIPAKAARTVPAKNVNEIKSPVFPPKKNRLIKLVPADPVENKSTL